MSEKKEIGQGEFDRFLALGGKKSGAARALVFCEECNDITTIVGGSGAICGHIPRWLKNARKLFEKVDNERQEEGN